MNVLTGLLDRFGGAVFSLPLTVLFLVLFDRQRFKRKWIFAVLFVLYMNLLFMIVGVPGIVYIHWGPDVNWIPFSDFSSRNIMGMLLNAVIFIPFGFFITYYFKKFRNWKTAVLAGFLLSLFIECIQLFTPRTTDIDDLIFNTAGAFCGFAIAVPFLKKHTDETESHDILKLIGMLLIILLPIIFLRYPLMDAWITSVHAGL